MHEPVTLSGGGLWIQFIWQGDRWGHRIGVEPDSDNASANSSVVGLFEADPPVADLNEVGVPLDNAALPSDFPRSLTSATDEDRGQRPRLQKTAILESIEGLPDQNWPPSPPLQELHLESRPEGKQLALLVGMAGTSHWSMSVEFDPLTGRVEFDVACRVKREPGRLGSGYQRSDSQAFITPAIDRIVLPMTVRWGYLIKPMGGNKPGELAIEVSRGTAVALNRHSE